LSDLFAGPDRGAERDAGAPATCAHDLASPPAQAALRVGGPLFNAARPGAMRASMALIWLAFIVFPLINAATNNGSAVRHGLTIAGAAAFVAAYLAIVLIWRQALRARATVALFVVMLGCASALTLADRSGWAFLFTYTAACAGLMSSARVGFYAVAACTALAAGESLIAGASGGAAVGYAASCAGVGLLIMVMRDLRVRNEQLVEARAELAKLAVAAERERFARDLHDLLGHTLSVITLKAELAGRLLPDKPDEAAHEVAEVEAVARTALTEVREAVSGYRQPTLDGELEGALMALSAAGIAASVERPEVALDPQIEAVLAWTVREGATNVIRHSHARHVKVKISATLTDAGVEVVDDGVGADPSGDGTRDTHGLAGLAERARTVRGHVEAGAQPGGGYRLAVNVPTGSA
jgi:two-component system sensor histidine kinase DesK